MSVEWISDLMEMSLGELIEKWNDQGASFQEKTARKMHICSGCHKTIRSGQKYWGQSMPPWTLPRDLRGDPEAMPIAVHTDCLDRTFGRLGNLGVSPEGWLLPVDHEEVDWGPSTASALYFPID